MNPERIPGRNKTFAVVGMALILMTALIFIIIKSNSNSTADIEYVAPDSPAAIVYADKAYLPLGSVDENGALQEDIAFFARKVYAKYNPNEIPGVIFNIKNKPTTTKDTLEFTGQYEEVKNDIKVLVKKLKNNRVSISITDIETGKNIDKELPSNSPVNKFIATLPIEKPGYRIYYALDASKITVSLFGPYSETSKQSALNEIRTVLGNSFVTDNNIDIYYTVPVSEQVAEQDAVVKGTVN